ncbi:ABC transporter ATP-binding protein [Paenibacillus allorhizosphaerae]|uniref:Lipid A export ATP-binding/permease protein MsbA n=1 Tax=Paenibacillus allorhizosphaerae TaxID=2849866 RepID=A0ABN7TL80_9BACL|nr:ABC transporter ATP-binding protein [Paenibacillus allorhizosphaerae]CAG7645069.1 Lipid A export ATP-binding/permease protein MsbA [Paenibacillus allorhizosphaerae]
MKREPNKEKLKASDVVSIAWRALTVSFRTKSKLSFTVNVLGFAMAFMPVWISTALRTFTDHVQFMSQGQETVSQGLIVFILLISLYIIQAGYTFVSDYCAEIDQQRTTKYIKKTIIDCASRVEYKYIENEGDFREKLAFAEMFGGSQVAASMQQTVVILQQLITFLSIIAVLSNVSAWVVVILLVTCIPAVVLSIIQKDEDYKNNTKNMREGAMSVHLFYMASGANEQCKSMNDVRFYGIYDWIKEKWRDVSSGYLKKKNGITRKHVLYNSIADVLRNAVYIGILLLVAKKIYDNPAMGLGIFMLVFTLSAQLQTATTKVFVGAARFFGDIQYMRDFFQLEDTPKEKLEEHPVVLERADILFDNVSFAYPNADVQALKHIDLTIKQGEKIAIVGENGSGKSTFINLLCGMHQPTSGHITVGGLDAADHLATVRSAISVVFQNFGKYETSIRDNITIGDRTRSATDEELIQLAKKTNAYSLIESQPRGLDEVVGTFSESGNNLSGGQWQKLAITRAIYRDKARIMVLDEPTAALDPVAEAQLYRDFTELTGDKTTILISHRLGITSIVDRILVFADGEIIEEGSHVELMALDGQYAKMYRAQAQWYNEEVDMQGKLVNT